MNNKLKKLIAVLMFLVGGVVLVVFGVTSMKQVSNFPQTDAVVAGVHKELVPDGEGGSTQEVTVYVTYTVDGKEYTEEVSNVSGTLKEGDSLRVCYNPEKPEEVYGASKTGPVIMLAMGAVCILASLGTGALTLIRGR